MPPRMTNKSPYFVLAFKGPQRTPTRLDYDDPLAALTGAVEYLKAGYQVRVSDGCVEWFAAQPVPDPVFKAAALANGQAAAFTGPPGVK